MLRSINLLNIKELRYIFGKIMNYDKIDAKELGQSLKGLGINLLVSSVKNTSTFLRTIFNIELFQQTDDFAIAKYENKVSVAISGASHTPFIAKELSEALTLNFSSNIPLKTI